MKVDFLQPLGDFQYSINLEYDLLNDDKVKGFLPTSGALAIIEDVLLSVMSKSTRRARLLTGAYGKGKSHMTLALLALLENREKKLFKNLLKKAKNENVDLFNNITQYLESGKKLFPVIVKTATNDLRTNLLNSLNISLELYGLKELMPATFFDVAVSTIQGWKKDFPSTYKVFGSILGAPVDSFVKRLKAYDKDAYNQFVEIHPTLTSGSEFNPLQGADVIKLYNNVIKDLRGYGYNGIFLVYDEFGKFLEGSIDTRTTANDLKLLQELAERSNRSDLEEQLHLLLISHKGIDNYVSNLTKEKTDNWKAIEGRFEKVSIQNTEAEIYELIAQVLKKDEEKYGRFYEANKDNFDRLEKIFNFKGQDVSRGGAFTSVLKSLNEDVVKKCYPIHPYSLLMLPKISELVAQNERSIFTFLAANDKNTVVDYIKKSKDEFPIIEPDTIYDYFESAFFAQPHGSLIREQWQITSSAIIKVNAFDKSELAIKILKTLALIYIINEFETLPPSKDLLAEIYLSKYSSIEIANAFNLISRLELLIELEYKPHVRIRNSSQNNLDQLIEDEIARVSKDFNPKLILQDAMKTEYFYPAEYNDTFEITRFFKFMFIEYEEFMLVKDVNKYIDNINSDGVILAILLKDDFEKKEVLGRIESFNEKRMFANSENNKNIRDRVVYILPKVPKLITEKLKKYAAIENLEAKNKADDLLLEELHYIKTDLIQLINKYIEKQYFKSELQESEYYYEGKYQRQVKSRRSLSALLSHVCQNVYSQTPKIINENINRNGISSQMAGARFRIVTNVLESHLKPNLGLIGNQDISVMRSIYVVPGIIKDLDVPNIDLVNCDSEFKNLFKIIEKHLVGTYGKVVEFSELYDCLTHAKYGIGLKRGVIPFYIAAVLREYKDSIVISRAGREQQINAQLLMDINEKPHLYSSRAEELTVQKVKYLRDLEGLFSGGAYGRGMSDFENIVKTMQSWYTYLPKFNREASVVYTDELTCEPNTAEHINFKKQLGYAELNAREFLLEKLPSVFCTTSYEDIVKKARKIKEDVEKNLNNALRWVMKCLGKAFKQGPKSSLRSTLLDYYETLTERTKNNLFDGDAETLMRVLKSNNNDEQIAKNLVRGFYGLRIEDLKPNLIEDIEERIKESKRTIDTFNSQRNTTRFTSSISTITYQNKNNEEKVIHIDEAIDKGNYASELLSNELDSIFEEYGESLSNYDKVKLLFRKIKELLD